jgi:GAF domain-containing protein
LVAIFLLDKQNGELYLHRDSAVGAAGDALAGLARLHVDDPQYHSTVSGSQKPFLSGHLSSDRRIQPVYHLLVNVADVESASVVPLLVHDRSLGELVLGSRKSEFFNNYDLQVILTAAGQLASAIEGASLATQTDESLRRRVEHSPRQQLESAGGDSR